MAKKKPKRKRRKVSYERERTILAEEQTILSKERTILSFMRTGITFIVLGIAVVTFSITLFEVFGNTALFNMQLVGWILVIIGFAEIFESYRRLRKYQKKMKQ